MLGMLKYIFTLMRLFCHKELTISCDAKKNDVTSLLSLFFFIFRYFPASSACDSCYNPNAACASANGARMPCVQIPSACTTSSQNLGLGVTLFIMHCA
jgi:hypothetical protein